MDCIKNAILDAARHYAARHKFAFLTETEKYIHREFLLARHAIGNLDQPLFPGILPFILDRIRTTSIDFDYGLRLNPLVTAKVLLEMADDKEYPLTMYSSFTDRKPEWEFTFPGFVVLPWNGSHAYFCEPRPDNYFMLLKILIRR